MEDTSFSILRSAKQFFAGTALSRLSGLFRDIAMAFCFGAAPEVAAFMVAYRLANLLRRLFGEGNLQAGFIPHFETLRGHSHKAAFSFYRDSVYSLAALLGSIVLLIEVIFWFCLEFMDPAWREIAELAMWMVPGLFFICLSALNATFLQCQKKYFAPAASPVLFNFIWILTAMIVCQFAIVKAIRFLSIGITFGFAVQWAATALQAGKEMQKQNALDPLQLFSGEWKKMASAAALGIVGVGAMQINSALDAVFARIADLSGPTYLWYAIRLEQLPLALFGLALAGALLPPLARCCREGNVERYKTLLSSSLKQSANFMAPCTFGLFIVGASGLNLLYGRGQFSSDDVRQTLYCLWGYGLGLIPASFVLLLAAGNFAKKSYFSPTLASLVSVGINILLNILLVFVFHLGPISIALATSASAWMNFIFLFQKEHIEPGFAIYLIKLGIACVFASLLTIYWSSFWGDASLQICFGKEVAMSRGFLQQIIQFFGTGLLFLGSFFIIAQLFRYILKAPQKSAPVDATFRQ